MLVPNNHRFSYLKMIILGCEMGVPLFLETPICNLNIPGLCFFLFLAGNLKSPLQNKVFSNRNRAHLGSRYYIYIYTVYIYMYVYIYRYVYMYVYICKYIYMYIHTLGFLKYMLILRIYMYTVYSSRLIQYPKWDVVWRIPWNSEPFFDPSFYGYPIPKPASLPVNSLAVQRCFPKNDATC